MGQTYLCHLGAGSVGRTSSAGSATSTLVVARINLRGAVSSGMMARC